MILGGADEALTTGWQVCATPAGAAATVDQVAAEWIACTVPATAASALRAAGAWRLEDPPRRFDAEDWWWRTRFGRGERADEVALCFDGLATVAEVWLNREPLLSSEGMFTAHRRVIELADDNELVICCRALDLRLAAKRPRPRWRAPMIEHQQLRWWRTTLLGRTPGWSPPAAAVGPWRAVRIERRRGVTVDEVGLRPRLVGDLGVLEVTAQFRALGAAALAACAIVVERDGQEWRSPLTPMGDRLIGRVEVPGVERWWPHTHGEPALYRARIEGALSGDLGAVGFRTIAVDRANDGFGLVVNGAPVFCRGACWTPLDPIALTAPRDKTAAALAQVRDAGMNMLRVGGTMVYEDEAFHDLADRLGLLIWQDFMFANMDYPDDDPAFVAAAAAEARQVLARLHARPSLAVLCGNSEGEQQAAMWGAPRERWAPRLFHEILPALAAELAPDVPYWPSSAHGGAFPHQADVGTTSYYGVGAYLRPLEDARRAEVRFASECLAFANVPEPRALEPSLRVHHPGWKARAPRDLGAGWDFDDVRDHYVQLLFGIDPRALRYADHERYLALGRVATGEVMAQVFGEWRRARSTCRGGLVWFLRDLWMGAGWGVVDAAGAPKAAYHYLRRALAPVAVHISDEGGNGLVVHVVNDRARPLTGELEVALWRGGEIAAGQGRRAIDVPARGALEVPVVSMFDGFLDPGWAYRFGPASCDLVVASMPGAASAFHFPLGLSAAREVDVGLTAEALRRDDGDLDVTVRTRRFAQAVAIDVDGFAPDDDYFHLAPGATRALRLRRCGDPAARGTLQPLNAEATTRLVIR